MRLFSFLAFSNDVHFHSTPSLITPIFIPRLLLWHFFSFPAFSYDAGYTGRTLPPPPSLLWWAGRPRPLASRSRTLPVKSAVWGMKDVRGSGPPFNPCRELTPTPTLTRISPHPEEEELNTYNYAYFHFPYSPRTLIYITRRLLMRRFSFRAFSHDAYFHYASSPMTLTFIPRILLRRLKKKEGAERKWHLKKFLWDQKC
jgi:hypothetical protein